MNDRTFAYAMHIATTPEKLWEALTRTNSGRNTGTVNGASNPIGKPARR